MYDNLFIQLLTDEYLGCSHFLLLWMLLWTYVYMYLLECLFSIIWGIYLRVEIQGHVVSLCFTFWGNARLCLTEAELYCSPTSNVWGFPISPHSHQYLLFLPLFVSVLLSFIYLITTILVYLKWYSLDVAKNRNSLAAKNRNWAKRWEQGNNFSSYSVPDTVFNILHAQYHLFLTRKKSIKWINTEVREEE